MFDNIGFVWCCGFMPTTSTTYIEETPPQKRKSPEKSVSLSQWDSLFPKLQEYKRKYGHLVIRPEDSAPLAAFIKYLRLEKKKDILPQENIEILNKLGFVWDTKAVSINSKTWEEMFRQLEKFKAEYGHLNVSVEDGDLYTWVTSNRYARHSRGRGSLHSDRVHKLQKIGFNFDLPINSSPRRLSLSPNHFSSPKNLSPSPRRLSFSPNRPKRRNRKSFPAFSPSKDSPSKWSQTTDDDDYNADEVEEKVDALEYIVIPESESEDENSSETLKEIELLKKFKDIYGNVRVHDYQHGERWRSLAEWCKQIRKEKKQGTLNSRIEKELTKLGFEWEINLKRLTSIFDQRLKQIEKCLNENGQVNTSNRTLYTYVSQLKHLRKVGKLPEDKIEKLDAIGFPWDGRKRLSPSPKRLPLKKRAFLLK